jgi:integrase/recombinase XerC
MSSSADSPSLPDQPRIDVFAQHLLGERRLSPLTVRNYKQALRDVFDYVRGPGRYPGQLDDIPERTIRSYLIEAQRTGLSRRTLHLNLSACRSFFRYALQQKWVQRNPFTGIRAPQFTKPLPKFLTETQMERFLDGPLLLLQEGKIDERQAFLEQLIFELLYAAGLRISELVHLHFAAIDRSSRILKIKGKGSKERLCPYGETAAVLLETWRKYYRGSATLKDPVLVSPNGKALSPGWVQRRMKVYLALAELPADLTPHKIRHSYATHLLNRGADLRLVQELLGHASLSTTQIYTHLDMRRLKDVHRQAHPHGR